MELVYNNKFLLAGFTNFDSTESTETMIGTFITH